ncbi:hypothetical protein Q0P57_13890, partial [Staphylococcus aureus]|nr:hypothetical protein [Staphylococcus aureus]
MPEGSLLAPVVVVYDKEAYVGGRSTVVFAHNDSSVDASELGAAIFVGANRNLVNAAKVSYAWGSHSILS